MSVRPLERDTGPRTASALARFERSFSYPLGPTGRFRIDHGEDYARFFHAMGEARCFVAEHAGKIGGVIAAAIRRVGLPDGTERDACYLGDLKIAPSLRGGRTLFELARNVRAWLPPSIVSAFAVVMDGTELTPDRYTGRAGLPALSPVSNIVIARLDTGDPSLTRESDITTSDSAAGLERFRTLSRGRYWTHPADPRERSSFKPE